MVWSSSPFAELAIIVPKTEAASEPINSVYAANISNLFNGMVIKQAYCEPPEKSKISMRMSDTILS